MKHSTAPFVALLIIAAALFAAPTDAEAQRVSLSEGIAAPLPTIVERDDALSLELNPAGLSHVKGGELTLLFGDHADGLNSGFGFLSAVELGKGLGMGFGVQFIQPGVVDDAFRKYSLGLGVGGDMSVGTTLNFFGSSSDQNIDDLVTWDLGVQYRFLRWLGFGLTIRDANSPFLGNAAITPQLVLGAAARSLQGRLLLEADIAFTQSKRVRPRFMVAVEPISGLRIFGKVQTDTGDKGEEFEAREFSAGLEINLPYVGASGAGSSVDDVAGFSMALRYSDAAWRSLLKGGKRFYKVRIGGNPPERAPRNILGQAAGTSFLSRLQQLERMLGDDQVEGILIELSGVSMGYGQAWEFREVLERFKAAGKPVVAYMHSPSHREFYIASVADHVMMGPSTTFNARGLALSQAYYRGALDKLGVKADFVRIAEYKSAPEAFIQEGPSEPAKEALNAFLDSIWDTQTRQMANGRGLGVQQLKDLINTAPHDPGEALRAGLVDKVIYPDELKDTLKELYGKSTRISTKYDRPKKNYAWGTKPLIAILHIDGNIVNGSGGSNPLLGGSLTGARTVEKIAQWATREPRVKAMVVRVDSPGGSATASDIMYRALELYAAKKPLIISMGDIAASGGYYVAAPGHEIFCNPTTLTGSIGIYSGKFGLEGLFKKVGYNAITTERGDRADLYSMNTSWNDEEREVIRGQITYLYELFLSQVSKGRDMERDDLHKVAKGRIWSGVDAQKVGLCDTNGGILAALEHARDKAGLTQGDYDVIPLPAGDILAPLIPSIGLDLGQVANLGSPLMPDLGEDTTDAQAWNAYAPLRQLITPLRPAIDLGVLYADGDPLALLPFAVDFGE